MPLQEILGHRRLVALIARSVSRQSLPPSLIFSGPAGVGKRLTAMAVAQLLNCTKRVGEAPNIDACGVCAACTRIARGVHSDVIVVEPGDSGAIKIEQIRDIVDRAGYRPFEGRCRVVIVDGADALVPAAQNALLKTLEEPPSASIFILVTSQPDLAAGDGAIALPASALRPAARPRIWSRPWCSAAAPTPRRARSRRQLTAAFAVRSSPSPGISCRAARLPSASWCARPPRMTLGAASRARRTC